MRIPALLLIATLAFGATTLSPEQRRRNVDSFEYVWKTVRDKHWDPKLGGVNWQAVHDELLPRVEAAKTNGEARDVVSLMLDRLHQTHFGIIPADAYDTMDNKSDTSADTALDGQVGLDLRILDGRAIVSGVAADSSAMQAGVQKGWEVVKVGGASVAPMIVRLAEARDHSRFVELMTVRALLSRMDGPIGSDIAVEFADVNGIRISKRLARKVSEGEMAQFGFLPPRVVNFESRRLPDGVEYIRFNIFLKPDLVVTRFGQAIHDCGNCPGVIVDVRGNPGGLGAMAMGIAGFLIAQPDQKLGTMFMRSLPLRFVIFPRAQAYQGPVAVLVDGFTASTAEIFAEGMQDLKRARVFGERTAGAALPSQIERLPNGDGFQYAMANYISESGRQLEGNGVIPDVKVALDRSALSQGRDSVLEAAQSWLEAHPSGVKGNKETP